MTKKQVNRQGIANIIFAVIVSMFLISCLTSCSARKVSKSKTETKEVTKVETVKIDSSKTTTIANSNTKIIDLGTEEEITISPIDNSKEMVVNNKKYFNVHLSVKKTSNNKVLDKSEKVSQIKQNSVKTNSKANKSKMQVVEMKKTDKKQFNILSLWWLLLIIPIYFAWKKYRLI